MTWVGQDPFATKNVLNLMARIVKFHAAKSVTTRTVIDSMELVYLLVQTSFMARNVIKIQNKVCYVVTSRTKQVSQHGLLGL